MKRNPDHGRPGPQTSAGLRELWATAAHLNEHAPGEGEWVPWRAIEVREAILPRERLDQAAVDRYAQTFDALPPVRVQAGTFVLIDGRHRLAAVHRATRDHIRIVELACADDELEDEATRANVQHGVPLSQEERLKAAKAMYARHHPDTGGTSGTAWTDARIAEWSGVGRTMVAEWVAKDRQKVRETAERAAVQAVPGRAGPDTGEAPHAGEYVRRGHTEATPQVQSRIGTDGKAYPVTPRGSGAAARAKAAKPAANGYQNAAALRKVSAGTATLDEPTPAERSAAALERLADAVDRQADTIRDWLDGIEPDHRADAARYARRMADMWARAATELEGGE